MFSGLKFIPRDQINKDENLDSSLKERNKSDARKKKSKSKRKSSRYDSSDDESLEKIKRASGKKKWYSSEEDSSSSESSQDKKKRKKRTRKRTYDNWSDDSGERSKRRLRSRSGKKEYTSEEGSSSTSDDSDSFLDGQAKPKKTQRNDGSQKNKIKEEGINIAPNSLSEKEIARKEMGLEWMLRSENKRPAEPIEKIAEQPSVEETETVNPKELNPYLRDDGSGYPEDSDGVKAGADQLLSSSLVGDGGASWRLKALKRAQEQAAREGRRLEEVVGERWGSLGGLTASLASHAAAPSRSHLRAIKSRKRGLTEEETLDSDNHGKDTKRDYLKDVSVRHREMRAPKIRDSLSWGKRKSQAVAAEDARIISAAASSINKFANDGNFMDEFLSEKKNDFDGHVQEDIKVESSPSDADRPAQMSPNIKEQDPHTPGLGDGMSANQLAAKAMQLRLKGKHEEAEKLLQKSKSMTTKPSNQDQIIRPRTDGSASRYAKQSISFQQKKGEDDADMHLAQKIMQNKQFKISSRADDEYDYEDGESRKSRKKRDSNDHKTAQKNTLAKRILTQQERCLFCLENPNRPMHLVVSIANHTYLMLPKWQPVVPGHCCILPIQHESATRTVDDTVWTEIRNFKKCLIMMFAKQEKEVVFLETVMGLAQQRRHCMIECIPLPQDIAKEAPLYFKKAIDEAEDEWSQHNAKKLIDTSQKGLRNSIPKHFPYFHVEFGLNKGFVHVIDDEKQFNSNLGLNVIRGMLHLAEEDMYRRRRYEAVDVQKQAVASFLKEWGPFDWTKQLHEG
ncbi:CWF19-like protein 2 [Neltuma alba]|uniref:CWF19-like protein 2 n=1 Tax=Neltuma alba TaxID=207710 RepID=UPI0010A2D4E0|nr:CWF19-like protein 2 [Prosopis alba]XP_028790954.1 CWF19-like protein 2 [Prosopis alba]